MLIANKVLQSPNVLEKRIIKLAYKILERTDRQKTPKPELNIEKEPKAKRVGAEKLAKIQRIKTLLTFAGEFKETAKTNSKPLQQHQEQPKQKPKLQSLGQSKCPHNFAKLIFKELIYNHSLLMYQIFSTFASLGGGMQIVGGYFSVCGQSEFLSSC